ncbi:HAMP domain-containing protein [bacterium 210820-DFI.6.37]|nr:HAMP domain-containing protein [bacterium 210820-DFI.6.37]
MKRFSIKVRVTIWYAFFLTLLVCLIFASLIYTSNRLVQGDIQGDLQAVVEDSLVDISIENGRLEIDDDMVNYRDGIYVLVYQENNFIVTGALPSGINSEIPFISDTVRKIRDSGKEFYVYDHLISEEDFPDVWVRGLTSADLTASDPAIVFMMRMFFILLPALILLAAIGGYSITKRAFLPVSQITETAGHIEAGTDLSQRIGLEYKTGSKDEIYRLSATFDRMLDRLERSFEAERQFSNDASHELRTPLSVIMAQCEYALKKTSTEDEARTSLEVILGQSKKMSALISQLLTLARADQGTFRLELEELNVSEVTRMVALEQEAFAAERGIELQQDIEPDLYAKVDESLFMRLWINLISNSVKYGKDGGFVRVVLKAGDGLLTGQVIDDGIGIPGDALLKIWDRFYQVNPSRSDGNSAGLGLSMVKWIVTAHHGQITADSAVGQGTRFTFTLPLNNEKEINDYERESIEE